MIRRGIAAVILCSVALPNPGRAAVEQEATAEIAFTDGCAGQGFYFLWDTSIHNTLDDAPGADHPPPVTWSDSSPIVNTNPGPSVLANDRLAFVLLAADGHTKLWDGFYVVDAVESRYLLRITLDCSTTPYSIVEMPNSAVPPRRDPGLIGLGMLVIGLALGLLPLTRRDRKPA
jgi:hypothetical protein